MNQIDKFCEVFSQALPIDDLEPITMDVSAILDEVRERDKTQHCVPRARLFREVSSGWNPEFQREGHAAYCAECESAAFVALRIRKPGLWIVAPAERNVNVRPVWWTRAVERHLEEAPARVRLLAGAKDILEALNENLDNRLEWAVRSRQAAAEGEFPKSGIWRSLLPEDALLVTELRETKKDNVRQEYRLSAMSRNLKEATHREGLCVRIVVAGRKHRVDKRLRLQRSGNLLQAEVPLTWDELMYLDPDVEKGGLPGVLLLEPELLDAEESLTTADNDDDEG